MKNILSLAIALAIVLMTVISCGFETASICEESNTETAKITAEAESSELHIEKREMGAFITNNTENYINWHFNYTILQKYDNGEWSYPGLFTAPQAGLLVRINIHPGETVTHTVAISESVSSQLMPGLWRAVIRLGDYPNLESVAAEFTIIDN